MKTLFIKIISFILILNSTGIIFLSSYSDSNQKSDLSVKNSDLFDVLKKNYANAKSIRFKFIQNKKNTLLGTESISEGIVEIVRINKKEVSKNGITKFRWETLKPDPSLLVSDGKKISYYTPPFSKDEHGQLVVRKRIDSQTKIALEILLGSAELSKIFLASRINDLHYGLKPLKLLNDIEGVELFLVKETKIVYKTVLIHKSGVRTELEIQNLQLNIKIDNKQFNFIAPSNTDLIKE